jgi:hypothetical protein
MGEWLLFRRDGAIVMRFPRLAGSPGSDGASPYHTSSLCSSESVRSILYIIWAYFCEIFAIKSSTAKTGAEQAWSVQRKAAAFSSVG